MSTPIVLDNPPENLDKLLQSATTELQQLEPGGFVRRMVSRTRVLELSNMLLNGWGPLVWMIDEELSPKRADERKAQLERLYQRAWVNFAAELAAEELFANTVRKQRRALARAVAEHDRFLFKWAMPIFGENPEHAEILADISRGTGAHDDAEDVLRLVALFRANWGSLGSEQSWITEAYLDKATNDATNQLDILRHGTINPARKLADAAYSLWYHDYEPLMQLGRFLTSRESDSLTRFPGIRELPSASAVADEEQDVDDDAADEAGDDVVEAVQQSDDPNVAA